ncbi:MAG: type II toxin-antitoxin system Phd/YefM family antitoxin [Methylophilaceae bacterium]|jgi:prevent-host-death family protein
MNAIWQLQEAKNHFSEVVEEALTHGPQTITRHGREAVVVMSVEEYRRMVKPKQTLLECLQIPAEYAVELDISRSRDMGRDVDL